MKDSDHVTKSSFSTALISFLVVVALPGDWVENKKFAAFIAAVPPLFVWAQVAMWKHGRGLIEEELIIRFKNWKLSKKVQNVLSDPCIPDPDKEKLKQHYSQMKIDAAIKMVKSHQFESEPPEN
ncbi:MAG: hypothetical protein ACK5G9_14860 [Akkermansiaceae bacterium]|jgi:hypothetical protein